MARSRKLADGVIVALTATAVVAAGVGVRSFAVAQDAPPGSTSLLRGLAPSDRTPLPGLAPTPGSPSGAASTLPDLTAPPDPATNTATGARGRDPRKKAAARRTRPPATLPVRKLTRAATVPVKVKPDVEPPLTGLPDPVEPTLVVRRRPKVVEVDPYASLGLKTGSVIVYPAIQQGIGYDTNPDRAAHGTKGSILLRTDVGLKAQSDWSAHELTADLRGGYSAYPDAPQANRPDGDGFVHLRVDIDKTAKIDAEGRYHIDTQRPGSPDLNAPVQDRPLIVSTGGSLGVTKAYNRLSIGLRGSVEHIAYEDARLPNGTIIPQGDRDQTTYGLRLRTAYEMTPGLTPFVDALIDDRIYDQTIDNAGLRRSSTGAGVRVGSTFEFTRQLTGEISAGYQVRRYQDLRLRDARGPVAAAALNWSVTPLTTVRLRGQSDFYETTVVGANAILAKSAAVEVQHDFRRNLSLTLAGTVSQNDYQGVNIHETGLGASAKLDYRLTRWLAFRASFLHEHLTSNAQNSSYTANTYLVGVRYQP